MDDQYLHHYWTCSSDSHFQVRRAPTMKMMTMIRKRRPRSCHRIMSENPTIFEGTTRSSQT
ncbi:hypothetical protein PVK06_008110 [Gossypium arboreum]|uniref:Uncharacterized protein n=1 Tax=Gossypium arboreum TaxID=29729 RepID=A0ABR0QKH4_GOSAR|nr:hypothetical protein PVK06_008110 [Gossypium arboreum]